MRWKPTGTLDCRPRLLTGPYPYEGFSFVSRLRRCASSMPAKLHILGSETKMPEYHWSSDIPATRGYLPNGMPVTRTEPSGSFDARIAILGLYPAAAISKMKVGERWMNLPSLVERTSFEQGVSASGNEIDSRYLTPLGLTRKDVLLFDLMPYFLLNTRKSNGRSMACNVKDYEHFNDVKLGLDIRPPPEDLVELARTLPGNHERLQEYLTRSKATLLLTLGSETAAFARGEPFMSVAGKEKEVFYRPPVSLTIAGVNIKVVHLAHPGLLMTPAARASGWLNRHIEWCSNQGQECIRAAINKGS